MRSRNPSSGACHHESYESVVCLDLRRTPETDSPNPWGSIEPRFRTTDLGAIDGTHIEISQPRRNLMAYTTRKSVTAVTLQAVCTDNLKFIDISAGWAGSMHDARIYRLSSLSQALATKLRNTNYYILGDCAYPLDKYLMKPFRNNGHLSEVFLCSL